MMNETNNIDSILNNNIDSILNNNIENRNIEENINKNRNISNVPKESVDNVLPIVIYRFKFTEEFMVYLYNFSKIHQYDDRKDFKEAWNVWTEENDDIIDGEMRRLLTLGYEGDVLDKMFKSARYYFRKKSTERTDPKQRRQYISVTKDLLDAMDRHIENNIYDENYQPKTGFITFCKDNETLLKDTISSIFEQGIKESELIEDKIKKTYKNRYFMLTNK